MLDKRIGNQNLAREKSRLSVPTAVVAQRQAAGGGVLPAKPSAAMAVPNRVMGAAISGAQQAIPHVANTLYPQAGLAKKAVGAVSGVATGVFNRLSADRANQQSAMVKLPPQQPLATQQFPTNLTAATGSANTAANASRRNATAKQYPNGRTVGGNAPLSSFKNPATPATQQRPTPGPGQHSTAVFSQQPGNNNQVMRHPDEINDNPKPATGRLTVLPRNHGLDGTLRTGVDDTMDVTFDEDTPLAARQAFMTDPLKPVAQMAQYDRRAQAAADQADFTQRRLLSGVDQQSQGSQQSEPRLLTKENSKGMGWKSRLAANNQIMENWRQQQQNNTQLEVSRAGNANQLENTRLSGTISGQNQLASQGLQNTGQLENTRLSGTIDGQNRLANTALSNQGRIQEIDRAGEIDTQQITQQGDIAAQAETRRLAGDAVLKGADPAAVQKGIMNTQGGATPDVTGIDIPQSTEAESYTYHAPQLDATGNIIPGTGGFAGKREPRLIPLDAAMPGQPIMQDIPAAEPGGVSATPEQVLGDPAKVQQFTGHLQKLKAIQAAGSEEEANAYLDALLQPDQFGVVDSAMYSLLMRELAGGR